MLKRVAIVLVSIVFLALRGIARRAGKLANPRSSTATRLVTLTYHAVRHEDLNRFERQMRRLKERATPVFADAPGDAVDRQTVAVTFDDAFQNIFDHALPVLIERDIPATIFVPTGFLGVPAGWIVPTNLGHSAPVVVTATGLGALDPARVRLGSHTVTHPRLNNLDSRGLWFELNESKKALEEITRAPVTMLSLPYGAFTQEALAVAAAVGYRLIFANVPMGSLAVGPALFSGRTNVTVDDWSLEFDLKIAGAYEWLALGIPLKRAIVSRLGKATTHEATAR